MNVLAVARSTAPLAIAGHTDASLTVLADPDGPVRGAADDRGIETVALEDPDRIARAVADRDPDAVCVDGVDPAVARSAVVLERVDSLAPSVATREDPDDPVADALEAGLRVAGTTVRAWAPAESGDGASADGGGSAGDGSGDGEGDEHGEDGSTTATGDPTLAGIVAQEPVARHGDDREALTGRLDEAAGRAFVRALRALATGRATVDRSGVTVSEEGGEFPSRWIGTADRARELRYGENPHQAGALYGRVGEGVDLVGADQVNPGARAMSFNNYGDADAALALAGEFDRPAAVVVKHATPAGCATADQLVTAYDRALATDPMSAYGGIVALNRTCDRPTAASVADSYKEVVVAPGYTDDALELLRAEESLRVLDVGSVPAPGDRSTTVVDRQVAGGRLLQERDDRRLERSDLTVVTDRPPTEDQVETMLFAWQVTKHVRSNAIVLADGTETVGVGTGQPSRVDAVRIAARKARDDAEGTSPEGSVLASDGFFPFPDGVERAAEAGVEAVVQPGGSVNDEDVIAAADDLDLAMAVTGVRCFRHG